MKAQIILAGQFEPRSGRGPLARALHDAGGSGEAVQEFLRDRLEFVADVEIDAQGVTHILSIRRRGKCPSLHESGVRCTVAEIHEGTHLAHVATATGAEIFRWP